MKYTKSIFLILFIWPLLLLSQANPIITVKNNSSSSISEAVVAVKWESITAKNPKINAKNFIVINSLTNKQVPYQLEYKGLLDVQNLLIQVDVKAKSSINFFIKEGKPGIFQTKTYARFVPERLDDFAWENDRIAFRAYGKALEGSRDDAFGLDVWVKRTNKMVVNDRYKRGEYHIDHGDGLDYYKVGFTLGAGAMAPYVKDTVRYSGNYHRWKLLDMGIYRSTFQLEYDSWNAAGIKVQCTRTISLDAGSQLNRIENKYTFEDSKVLPVAVGIIKRPEHGVILLNEQKGIMGYWEPAHGEDGITGVGTVMTTAIKNMMLNNDQLLTLTEVKNNEPIVYYAGAAWNKAGKIANEDQWFKYLTVFSQQLKEPLLVSVK